ncbi:MAG: signal peptidase I [Jatrophihabitantaceae bacterium]
MTDDIEDADRRHVESADSAQAGDLGDHLAFDSAVNADDEVGPGLPGADPPRRAEGGQPARRGPEAQPESAVLPPPGPDGPSIAESEAAGTPASEVAKTRSGRRRRKRKRRKAPWWELPLLVAIAIVVAVLLKTFVIQPFYIPSPSMERTLHGCTGCKGDRILVNKPIYDLRDPHPGDIVVFHAPPGWDEEPALRPPSNPIMKALRGFGQLVGFVPPDGLVLVKRVIAVGGQTVKGTSANGRDEIMISDKGADGPWRTLDEPYTYYRGPDPRAEFGPVTVPKDRLWVMGDHRDDSADSRFHCGSSAAQTPDNVGCDPMTSTVPIDDVIGKAVVIAWPPSRWRTLGTPSTFVNAALALAGELPIVTALGLILSFYVVRRGRRRQP